MKRIGQTLRLYARYVSLSIRAAMEHKASFALLMIGQVLASATTLMGIYFLSRRFPSVRGYTYGDVLLCFSIVQMQYTLAEMFARGFDTFSGTIRRGEFDRVLVRPRSAVLQVLGSRFELTRLGRMVQATAVFAYAVGRCGVRWTAARRLTLASMLLGGTALFSGLFMAYAALCFFTLEGLEVMNVLTDGGVEYGKYPVDVYGRRALRLATFAVPYALVQYYPLQYLTGRSENALLGLCPLGAGVFLLLCYRLWRAGVRRYQSSGS